MVPGCGLALERTVDGLARAEVPKPPRLHRGGFTLFNVVNSETFNDDPHVVMLFNVVLPETFNEDIHVIIYVQFVYKDPLKTAGNLVVLSVDVQSNRPVGYIDTTGFVAFCINFVLTAINNNLVLILLAPNTKAIPSVDVVKGTKYS
jgi:hypothetical protein